MGERRAFGDSALSLFTYFVGSNSLSDVSMLRLRLRFLMQGAMAQMLSMTEGVTYVKMVKEVANTRKSRGIWQKLLWWTPLSSALFISL